MWMVQTRNSFGAKGDCGRHGIRLRGLGQVLGMGERAARRQVMAVDISNSAGAPPAYFLWLAVRNFRCFGPRQELDLSDGKGRPSQWTIILGENGVGKTTLLQCLVALEPESVDQSHIYTRMAISGSLELLDHFGEGVRSGREDYLLEGEIGNGSMLNDPSGPIGKTRVEISGGELSRGMSGLHYGVLGLKVFGYGANRRMTARGSQKRAMLTLRQPFLR
ncbi:MAG: AAA family ATPase [Chloroflexia bacterium]